MKIWCGFQVAGLVTALRGWVVALRTDLAPEEQDCAIGGIRYTIATMATCQGDWSD